MSESISHLDPPIHHASVSLQHYMLSILTSFHTPFLSSLHRLSSLYVFLLFTVVPLTFSFINSLCTRNVVENWYPLLRKPWFTPPKRAFAPALTTLYFCVGYAGFVAFYKAPLTMSESTLAITAAMYLAQNVLNQLFTPCLFGLKSLILSIIVLVLMWILTLPLVVLLIRIDSAAGLCYSFNLIFVSYCIVLIASIIHKNPRPKTNDKRIIICKSLLRNKQLLLKQAINDVLHETSIKISNTEFTLIQSCFDSVIQELCRRDPMITMYGDIKYAPIETMVSIDKFFHPKQSQPLSCSLKLFIDIFSRLQNICISLADASPEMVIELTTYFSVIKCYAQTPFSLNQRNQAVTNLLNYRMDIMQEAYNKIKLSYSNSNSPLSSPLSASPPGGSSPDPAMRFLASASTSTSTSTSALTLAPTTITPVFFKVPTQTANASSVSDSKSSSNMSAKVTASFMDDLATLFDIVLNQVACRQTSLFAEADIKKANFTDFVHFHSFYQRLQSKGIGLDVFQSAIEVLERTTLKILHNEFTILYPEIRLYFGLILATFRRHISDSDLDFTQATKSESTKISTTDHVQIPDYSKNQNTESIHTHADFVRLVSKCKFDIINQAVASLSFRFPYDFPLVLDTKDNFSKLQADLSTCFDAALADFSLRNNIIGTSLPVASSSFMDCYDIMSNLERNNVSSQIWLQGVLYLEQHLFYKTNMILSKDLFPLSVRLSHSFCILHVMLSRRFSLNRDKDVIALTMRQRKGAILENANANICMINYTGGVGTSESDVQQQTLNEITQLVSNLLDMAIREFALRWKLTLNISNVACLYFTDLPVICKKFAIDIFTLRKYVMVLEKDMLTVPDASAFFGISAYFGRILTYCTDTNFTNKASLVLKFLQSERDAILVDSIASFRKISKNSDENLSTGGRSTRSVTDWKNLMHYCAWHYDALSVEFGLRCNVNVDPLLTKKTLKELITFYEDSRSQEARNLLKDCVKILTFMEHETLSRLLSRQSYAPEISHLFGLSAKALSYAAKDDPLLKLP